MTELFLNWLQSLMDFSTILNASIAASWMVLAVLILRFVLKKSPKWVYVMLWGLVAVRLIMPFSIESAFSLIPSVQTIPHEILRYQGTQLSQPAYVDIITNPNYFGDVSIQLGQTADRMQWRMVYMTFIWLGGIAVMLLYAVISYWRLHRKVATAVLYRDNIFQSENVESPFVLGIIKPKIYLPFNMNGQNIVHIIAHENAHISRKDHWWKPLGFALLAIHWFNPIMWLAYIVLCRDIELACDEKVIKDLENEQRADYTLALVSCSVNHRMIAACPLAFGEVSVKERVKSVMNYKKPAFWVTILSMIASIIVMVCFLTNPKSNDSWIKPIKDTAPTEIECKFALPIKAYAIFEDIYENGNLISSEMIIFDNFQDEGGASPRKMSISLHPQPILGENSSFIGEFSLKYEGAGTAHLTRKLPKDHYTGSGYFANNIGNALFKKQKIKNNDSIDLLTVIYSTDPEGGIGIGEGNNVVQHNDTVVIYRLVTSENKEINESNTAETWDLIPMVMINGELYLDTGYESTIEKRNDVIDGEIFSQVQSYEEPTENNQSNFGVGYKYQIGVSEGTVELLINGKWWIFATEEARQKIQFPAKEYLEIDQVDKITIESLDSGTGVTITSAKQITAITNAIYSAKWTEGTADCIPDFKIIVGDKEYLYHLSCGTINDNENNYSLSLDDVQKAELNKVIEDVYYSMTGNVFEGSRPISLPFLEAGKYIMPLDMTNEKVRISRGFSGQYPSHDGLDIAAPLGTEIFASADGTVVKVVESTVGDGNHVVIRHSNGYYTLYGHCSELIAVEGTEVKQGDVIAKVGSTGNSTGPHLHFELIFGYESEEGGLSIDVYNAVAP